MEINSKGVKNMLTSGPVVVMQVPEQFNAGAVQIFMEELGPLLDSNRSIFGGGLADGRESDTRDIIAAAHE